MVKNTNAGRQTIGADPLAALSPLLAPAESTGSETYTKAPKAPSSENMPKASNSRRTRATIHLSETLLEEVKDAVVHLSGPPERLTLAELTENALRRELTHLRKKHGVGDRFPPRGGDLKGGRRIAG
jgi:hypothetical protein